MAAKATGTVIATEGIHLNHSKRPAFTLAAFFINGVKKLDSESVRAYCLSFPHATENVQWGNDLVFKIAGKIFAVMVLEGPAKYVMSLKCTEETFNELIEEDGIDPAPYMARNKWVALERFGVLRDKELKALLRQSYDLVFEKLPKKTQAELGTGLAIKARKRR